MPNKLKFLTSTRFWAMLFAATIQYLQSENIITPEFSTFLTTIFAGFIGVRTVDRFGEKLGGEQKLDPNLNT